MEQLGSHLTDFQEILCLRTFSKNIEKIQISLKYTVITGTLHEDRCIFRITPRLFLLRMRNVSDKSCRENQNIHFVFNNSPPPENRAVYEIMWENIVERGRPQMTIWRMRIARWIPKATNTHSEYVIIIAFPLQQWLREWASVLYWLSCNRWIEFTGRYGLELKI